MKKISYRPVFNRKKHLRGNGTALLQIEAYQLGKKTYLSTGIYLHPSQWDNRRELIKNHPNAEALNYMFTNQIMELERLELDAWRRGQPLTLANLKLHSSPKIEMSLFKFIEKNISDMQAKESTKKNLESTRILLMQFNPSLGFKDISPKLVHNFEKFLFDLDLHPNTVAKHMKHLRSFVNAAIDKQFIDSQSYPFLRYHIRTKESKHSFLTPEELQLLEELKLEGKKSCYTHTRDAFLFCCYTGMRFSDFTNLTDHNLQFIDEKPWIVYRSVKTGVETKLPLDLLFEGKGWKMLRKYKQNLNAFFRLKANSTTNKELAYIGMVAGIKKHFSFHSARHTNATLLIYQGVNITTVQKLLGHRNIQTTQIYSEVMERTIVRDLKKCQQKKNR